MRTKTLLLTAAGVAAGLTAATAQDPVFSVNAVGYVNKDLAGGAFSLISNPLNNGGNTLDEVLGGVDIGTAVFLWNGAGFDTVLNLGNWGADGGRVIAPGGGFFIQPPADTTVTFVGEVPQGDLSNAIPAGLSVKSSQVPQAGTLADLGLADSLAIGDAVLTFNGAGFDTFLPGLSPEAPSVGVGDAFFVQAGADASWDRSFSVND